MHAFSRSYRVWLLALLLVTNALNLADRLGMAAVSQAIKTDLHFTDQQLGLIQGLGFAILYTLLGFPIARLAEHSNRTRIIAGALAVFGVMCWLCSTATSFARLLLFRIGVGIGDAGFGPPVASLIGDHFPMHRRASAMSIIWLGAPLGVVIGSTLGGWMAEHVSWRATFVAIGICGLLVAAVALFTLREPPRGMSDAAGLVQGPPPPFRRVLQLLLSKHSMGHVLAGCALAAIGMNAIGQFLAPFLIRNFHLGFAQTGRLLSLIAGGAMASGLALGGFGVDWAGRFDKRWYVWGPAIGLSLAAPAFFIGFGQTTVTSAIVWLMAAHITLFVYFTPTIAIAQNMVGANMRASSAFTVSLVLGLFGNGLGPTLLGTLSDKFARHAYSGGDYQALCSGHVIPALQQSCAVASATGIRQAMMAMSVFMLWAAVHYLMASRTLRADLLKQEGDVTVSGAVPAR
jgi:predicted MFS family arabinose efflux permease